MRRAQRALAEILSLSRDAWQYVWQTAVVGCAISALAVCFLLIVATTEWSRHLPRWFGNTATVVLVLVVGYGLESVAKTVVLSIVWEGVTRARTDQTQSVRESVRSTRSAVLAAVASARVLSVPVVVLVGGLSVLLVPWLFWTSADGGSTAWGPAVLVALTLEEASLAAVLAGFRQDWGSPYLVQLWLIGATMVAVTPLRFGGHAAVVDELGPVAAVRRSVAVVAGNRQAVAGYLVVHTLALAGAMALVGAGWVLGGGGLSSPGSWAGLLVAAPVSAFLVYPVATGYGLVFYESVANHD